MTNAATIVFADLVGFSRLPSDEQSDRINSLTSIVRHSLHDFSADIGTPIASVIALPTGDGMALGFLKNPNGDRTILEAILQLIMDIQQWAAKTSLATSTRTEVRIGVHTGPVIILEADINGHPNLCGSAINLAQRVMDAANPQQVLWSQQAVDWLLGISQASLEFPYACEFGEEVQISVKHGVEILVRPLRLKDIRHYWDHSSIKKQWSLSFRTTDQPWSQVEHLQSRWRTAKRIAMIAINGAVFRRERILMQLPCPERDGLVAHDAANKIGNLTIHDELRGENIFSDDLKELKVFIPDRQLYALWQKMHKPVIKETYDDAVRFWTDYLSKLRDDYAKMAFQKETTLRIKVAQPTIELWEYRQMAYLAYYFDWTEPGGLIRLNQYVWGVETTEIPGFEVEWRSKPCPPAFAEYLQGLENLQKYQEIEGETGPFLSQQLPLNPPPSECNKE